jgi:hypothetical protein
MPISKLIEIAEVAAALVDEYGFTISNTLAQSLATIFNVPNINLWNNDGTVNFLDNTWPGSDVPLQFQSMPADCRTFYTADDINNITKTWSRIAAGNITCVDGGSKPGTPKKNGVTKVGSMGFGLAATFVIIVSAFIF